MSSPALGARPNRSKILRDLIDTGWPIAALVIVFMVLDRAVRLLSDLGIDGYREPVLLAEFVRQNLVVVVVAGTISALLAWRSKSCGPEWPSFEQSWSLRVPVGVIVVLLTWAYAFYDYNLWADHLHALDRVSLIAVAGLALWRPVFLAPWTFIVTMLAFQFRYPIGVDQLAESFQLIRVAELFVAVVLVRLATSRWYQSEFVLVTVALIASAYWVSGLGKLRLGWFAVGPHLDSLFFATHANGWLGFLSADDASSLGRTIGPFLWPMFIIGAVIELGALVTLWGRRPLQIWLVGFIAFHVGIFGLTGISFWKWVVFELTLLAFLRRDRLIDHLPIFDLRHAAIATVLIVAGPLWSRPVDLSWLDSPVSYVYRFEASMSDGTRHELPPAFFRPHDYLFTLSPFGYLSPEPKLPIVWGAIRSRDDVEALYAAENPAAVFALEAERGVVEFDAVRAAALDEFLVEFAGNWNQRRSRSSTFSTIGPPPQLWTWGSGPDQADIEQITVWQVTTHWDGNEYHEIRTVKEREVTIPPAGTDASP